jgi:hypothetical protein
MSVIMTLRAKGDPQAIEERAGADPEGIRAILDRAVGHGLIAHRFYGSEDGQIMVVDEWPDGESFLRFFEESRSEIQPLMEAAGVTQAPEITIWRKLDTRDDYGWGA